MPLDFERAEDPKVDSWDNLQSQLGSSDVNFDDKSIKRKAGGSNEQVVRSITDSLWAGSAKISEEYELENHIKEMVESGRPYPALEKALHEYGYPRAKIRRIFNKVTKIDPVMAYLDTATYTIPPDAVPRYNYGWGPAKNAKADYFFIMPFTNKYAVYKQTGLDREIVFQHVSVAATRDELKKHVKDVRAVTPDSLDTDSDIIQRAASISVPRFDNTEAQQIASQAHHLKRQGEKELAKKIIVDAIPSGLISESEGKELIHYVEADDPSEMSQEEILEQEEMNKYQKEQESRTLDDEMTTVKIPQEEFNAKMEKETQVDMKQLSSDAFDLLTEISASVPGYTIEPISHTVDLVNIEAFTSDPSNHIDSGSIRFITNITDLRDHTEKKGLVIMFIVNGLLQYSGKFKGEDNREYALSTPGLNSYFDNAASEGFESMTYTPQPVPEDGQTGPYR